MRRECKLKIAKCKLKIGGLTVCILQFALYILQFAISSRGFRGTVIDTFRFMFLLTARVAVLGLILYTGEGAACEANEAKSSAGDVFLRFAAGAEQMEKLDQHLRRLEASLFAGLTHVDEHGILRDATGRAIGIWGIDSQPAPRR